MKIEKETLERLMEIKESKLAYEKQSNDELISLMKGVVESVDVISKVARDVISANQIIVNRLYQDNIPFEKILKSQKEESVNFGTLITVLFGNLIKFLNETLTKKVIKVQPTIEHYSIPQSVMIIDPFTGKPIDWSNMLSSRPQRGGGSGMAGGPAGTSSVVSVLVNGDINGVNKVYTLASVPLTGVLYLSIGRQEQIEGTDFTRSGDTITYTTAPDISLAGYPHRAIIY